ncbi:MAG TPA: ABC transporter permease [Bryobacteraceae bacterium]|jgi:putative ABC transport system permease protein
MPEWRWLFKIRVQLRALFRRDQMERELEEEFQYHLDQQTEVEQAAGKTLEDAAHSAKRALGGITQKKEECRDMRRIGFVESTFQDLRYALRSAARTPGFTVTAVLTLALGMGASLAILSVIDSVLLRPLPFPDAERLTVVYATVPARNILRDTTSFPDFTDWKTQSTTVSAIAAWRLDPFNLAGAGAPTPVTGLRASFEIFNVLGVAPMIGRGFDEAEQKQAAHVALIGYGFWRSRFGGSPDVLTRSFRLNDESYSIIGVLPQGFQFPGFTDATVMVPLQEYPSRSRGYLRGIARLKPEVKMAAASQEFSGIASRLAAAYPPSNQGRGLNLVPLRRVAAGEVRIPLLILMAAAGLVLLIGCANVGNLVLVRAIARERELGVRSALGAGAARLIRQILTESVLLAVLAAIAGSAIAFWGSRLLTVSLSESFTLPPVRFDWILPAIAASITITSGLLSGVPPAILLWRSQPGDGLREGSRGLSGGRRENRLQNLLVAGETALTVVLIVGAGLLLKSFALLQQTDLGMNPHNVLLVDLVLSKRYAEPERRATYLTELLDSVHSLPGIRQAAVHTDPPFLGGGSQETFHIESRPDPAPDHGHVAAFNVVSNEFFAAMGMTIRSGRAFDRGETTTSTPPLVINETMARRFWPGENPLGKRIRFYYDKNPQRWLQIVGVVRDARYGGRDYEPVSQTFVPFQVNTYGSLPYAQQPYVSLAIRTQVDPASLARAVQERIWAVDRDQPIAEIETADEALSQSVANRRIYLLLVSAFAVIALLVAASGVYGLISYAVERRTREMGIRVAVGATKTRILSLLISRGMLLALVGVAAGIVGSMLLTKTISGLLYGITPTDPFVLAATSLLFLGVAFLAALIPANRAATVDPTAAFRSE